MSDERKMIDLISSQLPDGEGTVPLGGNSEGQIVANIRIVGDDIEIVSNCPEWVTLREVYEHFRWNTMPSWEQRNVIRQRVAGASLLAQRIKAQGGSEPKSRPDTQKANHSRERLARILADLPEEVSTEEAAQILGQSKDTVLRFRASGLLEFRNAAPPGSTRPVYRFTLASVLNLRKSYDTEEPTPRMPKEPYRRRVRPAIKKYKHVKLED
jgi:hypothetical protein